MVLTGFFVLTLKDMLTKVCKTCGAEKQLDDFYKNKQRQDGRCASCKQCASERSVSYYRMHREERIVKQREYYEKNKDATLLRVKNYRDANKEKVAARKKKWKQDNADKVNANNARRRAVKILATPSWANEEAIDMIYKQAAEIIKNGIEVHVDHIVPLKSSLVCGLHCEANLQLLTASENLIKNNRHWPDQW